MISEILRYIEENLFDRIDYDVLSRKVGYNKYSVMRIFSASRWWAAPCSGAGSATRTGAPTEPENEIVQNRMETCGFFSCPLFPADCKNFAPLI